MSSLIPPSRHRIRTVLALGVTVAAIAALSVVAETPAYAGTTSHLVSRTVNLRPVADSYSSSTHRRTHYGRSTRLIAGSSHGNTRKAYLRFVVPSGGSITSAKLTITRTGHWYSSRITASSAGTRHWSEHSFTTRSAPHIGPRITSVWISSHRHTATFNLTRRFRAHRSSTIVLAATGHHLVQFSSRQARHARPTLRVVIQRRVQNPAPHPTPRPAPHPIPGPVPVPPVAPPPSSCTLSTKLVPSCGRLWGVSPMNYQALPLSTAVAQEEAIAKRPMDIVHTYHINDQLFPTAAERAEATQPGRNRLLLINWKPATDMSWKAVAAGGADARIDRLAAYIHSTYTRPFFLTIFHEPENDVRPAAGSGWTAADYAAMYRHTVLRLRAGGVTNAITVMNYMAFDKWAAQSWFSQLWPGDDVVDWIGLDPYGTGATTGYTARDFNTLVNRPENGFPGYYTWATHTHPGKPLMLAEWGVNYVPGNPAGQATFFNSVRTQINNYPDIRAFVYWDLPKPPSSDPSAPLTTVTLNPDAEAAFQALGRASSFAAPQWSY